MEEDNKTDIFSSDESDIILTPLTETETKNTFRSAIRAVRNSTIIIRQQEKKIEKLTEENKELKYNLIRLAASQLTHNNNSLSILNTVLEI